jgi:hypothetical protein
MVARLWPLAFTLLVLPGCNQMALNGQPDFPTAGMLTPASGQIVTAARAPSTAAFTPPLDCQAVIVAEDALSSSIATAAALVPTASPAPAAPPLAPGGAPAPASPAPMVGSTTAVKLTFGSPDYLRLRNNCIESYIGAIDYQYAQYKAQTIKLTGGLTAAADSTSTILSAASAGVGGTTGQILSGLAAAIGTVKGSISQDVLYNNSIVTVIMQMDADRNEQHAAILKQMQQDSPTVTPSGVAAGASANSAPGSGTGTGSTTSGGTTTTPKPTRPTIQSGTITRNIVVMLPATADAPARKETIKTTQTIEAAPKPAPAPAKPGAPASTTQSAATSKPVSYTMYQASIDLLAYYEAGTFPHAIVAMQQSSGAKATNCKAQVNNLKTTGTTTGAQDSLDPAAAALPLTTTAPTTSSPAQPNAC